MRNIYLILLITLLPFNIAIASSPAPIKQMQKVVANQVEQIPDEKSKCYKQCSEKRLACRKKCMPISKLKDRYKCLDACDPPFNNTCVPKCPTVDNV